MLCIHTYEQSYQNGHFLHKCHVSGLCRNAYGMGTGPVEMRSLQCKGVESGLRQCIYEEGSRDCDHLEDIAVECTLPTTCAQNEKEVLYNTVYSMYASTALLCVRWTPKGLHLCFIGDYENLYNPEMKSPISSHVHDSAHPRGICEMCTPQICAHTVCNM